MLDISGFPISIGEWILLSFVAYRLTQFFVFDSMIGSNPESGSRFSATVDKFAYTAEGGNRSWLRGKIGDLLTCPWCLGFWLSVLTYFTFVVATDRWSGTAIAIHLFLGPFAVAGGQGFLNSYTGRTEA